MVLKHWPVSIQICCYFVVSLLFNALAVVLATDYCYLLAGYGTPSVLLAMLVG